MSEPIPKVLNVAEAGELNLELIQPQRVEDDSPKRCQHSRIVNQCNFGSVEGQTYCAYHIALHVPQYRKQNRLKKYKLVQHYARIDELCSNQDVKNLNEEVGILNYSLETLLNQCHTPWDIQVNQHRIESLVEKISKTMLLSHKLQTLTGQVLDKQTLAIFVDDVLKVISDEIQDAETLKRIGNKIGDAVEKAQTNAASSAFNKDKRQIGDQL